MKNRTFYEHCDERSAFAGASLTDEELPVLQDALYGGAPVHHAIRRVHLKLLSTDTKRLQHKQQTIFIESNHSKQ